MEFKINVNQVFKTIEMNGEQGLSSFSNKVYFESMSLEDAVAQKVAPWIASCVEKANKDTAAYVMELHNEGKTISEICIEANTNEFFVTDTIRSNTRISPLAAYYREQLQK
jgi:hypothetical protein